MKRKKDKRFWILSVFCVFILAGLIWSQEEEENQARFGGKVLDQEKKSIDQAQVQLNLQGANKVYTEKSNKKGDFSFRMLFPGKYVLTVTKEGYQDFTTEIELQPGAFQKYEISLAKALSPEQKNQQEAYVSFQKGVSLAQEKKLDEAIEAFRTATELKTDFAEAYINLGALLFQKTRDDEAEKALVRALELKPDEPKIKEILGNINFEKAKALLQKDKFDEAMEKLKISYDFNPNYPFTSYLFGYTYSKKGMNEEAIKYFEAFLQMAPDSPQAAQVKEILVNLKKEN